MPPSYAQVLFQDPISEEGPSVLFSQGIFQETVETTIPNWVGLQMSLPQGLPR